MLENAYKTGLCERIRKRIPGAMVLHLDPDEIQGIPDLLILWRNCWATLEVKKSADAPHRPNQNFYVEQMNEMSFSAFIYPENEEVVLNELCDTFQSYRSTCNPFS